MNERQRLISVLEGGVPERLPWYADLSYLYSSLEYRKTLPKRFAGAEGYLRFHQDLGAGICYYAPCPWEQSHTGGVTEDVQEQAGLRITTLRAPIGSVREVQRYLGQYRSYNLLST